MAGYYTEVPAPISARLGELIAEAGVPVVGVRVASYPGDNEPTEYAVTLQHSPVNIEQGDGRRNPRIGIRVIEHFFDGEGTLVDTSYSGETREGRGDYPSIPEDEWKATRYDEVTDG